MKKEVYEKRVREFRPRLLSELEETDKLIAENADNGDTVDVDQRSEGVESRMEAVQDQEMALEVERRRTLRRDRIMQALERMDEGEFGYCIDCGREISEGRLNVDPALPQCIRCAERSDHEAHLLSH